MAVNDSIFYHYFKEAYIYFDKLFQVVLILESKQSGLRDDLLNRPGVQPNSLDSKNKKKKRKKNGISNSRIQFDLHPQLTSTDNLFVMAGMSKLHEYIFELLCLYGPLSKITLS